jgi:acyl-CoA thioesterase
VKSLDMSLHLSGREPTEWTLMSITTPPIHEGSAVAHAVLRTADGAPLATVDQHVLVHPLER